MNLFNDEFLSFYEHEIYLDNNTESIDILGSSFHKFLKQPICNNLFYGVCDLLSLDFKKLCEDLEEALDSEKKDKICNVLLKYHPLLLDDTLIENIFTQGLNIFSTIICLVEYVDRLPYTKILSNPEVFNKFVMEFGHSRCYNYSVLLSHKEGEILDKIQPKGPYAVDKFLKRLKFDKILEEDFARKSYILVAEGINEFICSSIYYILKNNFVIKRCKNCGKFFVAYNRSDTIYCDRISPDDTSITCKEYASKKLWYKKSQENEASHLYRNIYQQKQMLTKRNPDIGEYKTDFENFKTISKEWKKKLKEGVITESKYLQWLKDVKEKKVKPNGNNTQT